jgi:hypothetical protein
MKIFIFVLDNLHSEPILQGNNNSITNEDLIDIFLKWNNMYIFSRKESFSENELYLFEVKHYLFHLNLNNINVYFFIFCKNINTNVNI